MKTQIEILKSRLEGIGFEIIEHDGLLQITKISKENSDDSLLDLESISHVIQVVIELEDPLSLGNKFIFQNCSLKVYYEGWEAQEAAKIIKLNIAGILSENGIFDGMDFVVPINHEEIVVP
jgi:hypothetical protein